MTHEFELTLRNDETGEQRVESFTIEDTTPLAIDFFYYAWEKAMYYGFSFHGYTLLGIRMVHRYKE